MANTKGRGIVGSEGHSTAETFDLSVTAGTGTTCVVKDKDGTTVTTGSDKLTEGELYVVTVASTATPPVAVSLTINSELVTLTSDNTFPFTAQEDMTLVSAVVS